MKCKVCDGSGITKGYDAILGIFFDMKCFACDGSGEVDHYEEEKEEPLTNEEWIKQCNTEQLEDVLWEKINGAFNSGYACCNLKQDKDYVGRYKRFKEWLKQPHTNE